MEIPTLKFKCFLFHDQLVSKYSLDLVPCIKILLLKWKFNAYFHALIGKDWGFHEFSFPGLSFRFLTYYSSCFDCQVTMPALRDASNFCFRFIFVVFLAEVFIFPLIARFQRETRGMPEFFVSVLYFFMLLTQTSQSLL